MATKRKPKNLGKEAMTPELLRDLQNTRMKLTIWAERDDISLLQQRRANLVIDGLDFWESSYPDKPLYESIAATIRDVIAFGEAMGKPAIFLK